MLKKRITRCLVSLILVSLMMCVLSSCATTLEGTYTSKEGLIEQSFTFKEDNKVEVSAFGLDIEGEYKIEDEQITITYGLWGFHYDMVKSFKKDGNSIFIDGTEFVKE